MAYNRLCLNSARIELLLIGARQWCRRVHFHSLHSDGSDLLTADFVRKPGVILGTDYYTPLHFSHHCKLSFLLYKRYN